MYKQLITYDVPATHDRLRQKIAEKLLDYGLERIQYSVFVGKLSKNQLENLKIDLLALVGGDPADVRVFNLNKNSHTVDDVWSEHQTFNEVTFNQAVVVY